MTDLTPTVAETDGTGTFSDKFNVGKVVTQRTYTHATALECKAVSTGKRHVVFKFSDNSMSVKETASLIYETQVLGSMNHPNIIKSGGYYAEAHKDVMHHF